MINVCRDLLSFLQRDRIASYANAVLAIVNVSVRLSVCLSCAGIVKTTQTRIAKPSLTHHNPRSRLCEIRFIQKSPWLSRSDGVN